MPPRRLALLAALTVLYVVAGRFGLSLAFVNESASAIWPSTGIALAVCLLGGNSLLPAVFLGALIVNLTTSQAVFPSLLIACGNTAEAALGAWLIRKFAGGAAFVVKSSWILCFMASAIAATAVAATIGTAALLAGGLAQSGAAPIIWLTWWAGDLSSALLLTPAIAAWAATSWRDWTPPRALEAIALALVLVAAAYWVFGPTAAGLRRYPVMFVTLPGMLWAGLRFGPLGAATAVLGTAAVATWGTLNGAGPFARGTPNESLLLLQAYLGVKAVVMQALAAEVSSRLIAERDIRQLNLELEQRIASRSEELLRLHGRLAEAQHVAHIGSWDWDMAANSIWWSDEMYRVYGVPIGSLVTYERFLSAVHPEDRDHVKAIVGNSARTGEPFTMEHRAIRPDGTTIILHSQGRVMIDDEGRAVRMLGIGHDVTDRKRAEEERLELVREQARRREAEDANRLKDYFLATLSHELRTPLNAIVGWAHILRRGTTDADLRDKAIDAIQRNVTIQAQLVSDILDVARIRSGTITLDVRPTALAPIVDGALDIVATVIAERKIVVSKQVGSDLAVIGDARRLQQVCWNLLSNAVKFVEVGGSIWIHATQKEESVLLVIEDDGAGIPEDFLPHVFEQFRQADASVTRSHGGLGLGLAISRDLVLLHGGSITVANRPAGGASFTVRLPAARADELSAEARARAASG